MKAFTDLQQSKKLAEILPIESADMWFVNGIVVVRSTVEEPNSEEYNELFPCWSLAALLDILPTLDGRNAVLCKDIRYDEWHICYHSTATLSVIDTERYDNPIDACYEMIIKLNELNLL